MLHNNLYHSNVALDQPMHSTEPYVHTLGKYEDYIYNLCWYVVV